MIDMISYELGLKRHWNARDFSTGQIQQIVRAGKADRWFEIGEQLDTTWDQSNVSSYNMPLDIVSFADAVNASDQTVPALWLQSHWLLSAVQFDASEAIWYCAEALEAGTYSFTIGSDLGTNIKAGTYNFTTTEQVPVGGQLVIASASSIYIWGDVALTDAKLYTFSEAKSVTPLETLAISSGDSGTSLGTLATTTKYGSSGLNNLQRCVYGYNRWSQSAIRQWLNSDKGVNLWWEPQNVYDRPPQQLATLRGFLVGLDSDFLNVVQPVKVVTALNTVSDSEIGASEVTYDRFFLPSLEQEYIVPQASGVEGAYWPYWKERLGLSSPQASGSTAANAAHIRYAIENHTSAQNARLRSASRSTAGTAWYVVTTGYAGNSYATTANRPAPACVIC